MTTVDTAPLDQLIDVLRGAGLEANMNAAELNLPGAWVTLDTLQAVTVGGGLQLTARVFLIVGETDNARALGGLLELMTKLLTVITPDGQVQAQGVVMPDGSTPLPALSVPVNLYT